MGYIADDVREAAAATQAALEEIPQAQAHTILKRARELYDGDNDSGYLWKDLNDPVAMQDPDAWRWISEFVGNRSCILFFDRNEESVAFALRDGSSLTTILEESVGFEFYVTDEDVSYLLCFNHHDYLIAAGSAASWLEKKAEAA